MEEYVNVVYDVFEFNYSVVILCFRGEFDLKELSFYEGEDWFGEEDEGLVFVVDLSEKVEGEGGVMLENLGENSLKFFCVERIVILESEDLVVLIEVNIKR